jgi:SH3 domain-containing YSC84-like protein 1
MAIRQYMRWLVAPAAVSLLAGSTVTAQTRLSEEAERVQKAQEVLQALTGAPDEGVPSGILERAQAVVVIPSFVKGGFMFGGEHGKGIMSVREASGRAWSAPAFVSLTGGTFGAQFGLQAIDLVLFVLNRDAVDDLLRNELKLGGSASVAAGPIGRAAEASTDISMSAKILAYSRSRGLFAGLTIEGATLRPDKDANARFYGREYSSEDIVLNRKLPSRRIPLVASQWRDTLKTLAEVRAGD